MAEAVIGLGVRGSLHRRISRHGIFAAKKPRRGCGTNWEFCGRARFCWREPATLFPSTSADGDERIGRGGNAAGRLGVREQLRHAPCWNSISAWRRSKDSGWTGIRRPRPRRARSSITCARLRPSARASRKIRRRIRRCVPQATGLEHLDRIAYYEQQDAMILDAVTDAEPGAGRAVGGGRRIRHAVAGHRRNRDGHGRTAAAWLDSASGNFVARNRGAARGRGRAEVANGGARGNSQDARGNPGPRAADEPDHAGRGDACAICWRCGSSLEKIPTLRALLSARERQSATLARQWHRLPAAGWPHCANSWTKWPTCATRSRAGLRTILRRCRTIRA